MWSIPLTVLGIFAVLYLGGRMFAKFAMNQVLSEMNDYVESGDAYPQAPPMPPVVEESFPDLLSRLDGVLQEKAPQVAATLRPGLTLEQIRELEREFSVTLTEELRQLYQWHDGQNRISFLTLTAADAFVPLRDVMTERMILVEDIKTSKYDSFRKLLELEKDRLNILRNGSGDGYSVDLARKPEEGATFYSVHDDFDWMFYPSLKNLFAAITECYEAGAHPIDLTAPNTTDLWVRADLIHEKYGVRASPRDVE